MTVTLDAYALIAYFRDEAAAGTVEDLLRAETHMSVVNAAEVLDVLVRVHGATADEVEADMAALGAC